MRFAGHRDERTYPAAYQCPISIVDGQATFFELDRQNAQIHELFRGFSLRRDYDYRPTLPEALRWELQDPSPNSQKEASGTDTSTIEAQQKLYDQRRQARERALRERHSFLHADSSIEECLPYESDFMHTRKLMPERDRLAENLFKTGSLRTGIGRLIMDDLVRLLQTPKSETHCPALNGSFDQCDTCHCQRSR